MTDEAPTMMPGMLGAGACGKHSLARLETAMWWLEVGELEVFDLIADGALVAFNLARPGAERRLPGIWSRSLLGYWPRFGPVAARWGESQTSAATPLRFRRRRCDGGQGAAAGAALRGGAGRPWRGKGASTAEVLTDLLPPGGRDLRFDEVLRVLGIKRRLLHDLLSALVLSAVPGTGDKVSKAPLITRGSVVEFLTARRI